MDALNTNKLKEIISVVVIATATILMFLRFDTSEAALTNGEKKEIGKRWDEISGNDTDIVKLPRAFPSSSEVPVILQKNLEADCSGLTMLVTVYNADIQSSINEDIIYDSTEQLNSIDRTGNEYYIDLPQFDNEITVSLELTAQDKSSTIFVKDIVLIQREQIAVNRMKKSLPQLFFCVILILSSAMFLLMGVIRHHAAWREMHLFRFSGLCLCMAIYGVTSSYAPVLFFGNELFFRDLAVIMFGALPLFLTYAFLLPKRGVYGKIAEILSVTVLSAVAILRIAGVGEKIAFLLPSASMCTVTAMIAYGFLSGQFSFEHAILCMAGTSCITLGSALSSLAGLLLPKTDITVWGVTGFTMGSVFYVLWQAGLLIYDYRRVVEQSEQEAIRASEAKGRFLAHMSHEIRTPINAILGMDEMILRTAGNDNVLEYASDIRSAGNTLLAIVNDVLDISKIESGKMEIIPRDYRTIDVVRDVVNMALPKAKQKQLNFDVKIDPLLPSGLYGDDTRIRQILINLLSNAVKYTEKGSVQLSVSWKETKSGAHMMRCMVRDTGVGMKEEDIPKLFAEYERIEEGKHRGIEGTGLGMSITVNMLSLMGSRLKVKSRYGEGSVFWFDLKQRVTDKTPVGRFDQKTSGRTFNAYQSAFTAPEAKLLVVDDNAMNRKVVRELLKETGVQIVEAGSGEACLKILRQEHFHLILLDHMMPGMDGVETLQHIRQENLAAGAPVYVLTANALAGSAEEYARAGFDGFLAKPINAKELEKTVQNALPKDLILDPDKKKTQTDKSQKREKEKIPEIPGVDIGYAKQNIPEEKILYSAIVEFYKSMGISLKKLQEAYREVTANEEEGIADYRIEVHGMKGAAATIGALELSDHAKHLEYAAKAGDRSFIESRHKPFVQEWKQFHSVLGKALGIKKKNANRPLMDKDTEQSLIREVQGSMETMDIDRADEAMKKLMSYSHESSVTKEIRILQEAVTGLDQDKVAEITGRILSREGQQ